MKLYHEQIQNRDRQVLTLLFAVTSLSFLFYIQTVMKDMSLTASILLLTSSLGVYLIFQIPRKFPLSVSIGSKKLRIQSSLLFWKNIKLKKEEVAKIEFFQLPNSYFFSGWNINYSTSQCCRIIQSSGNSGILLELKSGKRIILFSKDVYNNKETIISNMKLEGWPVEKKECY